VLNGDEADNPQSNRVRRIAIVVFLIAIAPTMFFGFRTYGSLAELRKQHVTIDVASSSSWTRLLAGLP